MKAIREISSSMTRVFASERKRQAQLGDIAVIILFGLGSLMTLGALEIQNAWLATIVSVAILLVFPGFLTSAFMFRTLSPIVRLPVSFVLSIGMLVPIAALVLNLHLKLDVLIWLISGINSVLLVAQVSRSKRKGAVKRQIVATRASPSVFHFRVRLLLMVAFGLGALVTVFVFLSTAVVWRGGDRWVYLAYIRQYLDLPRLSAADPFLATGDTNPRMALNGWLVLLALLSRVSSVDPVSMFSIYLPPILMILALLSVYGLSDYIFQNRNAALLTSLLQVLHYTSSIVNEGPGVFFFIGICEDKYFAWLVILPTALLFAFRFIDSGQWSRLFAVFLSALALALIHPLALPLFALSWGAFSIVHFLFSSGNSSARVSICLIVIGVLLAVPLVQRIQPRPNAYSLNDSDDPSLQNRLLGQQKGLLVISRETNKYIAHPVLLRPPLTLLSLLLAPFLIKRLPKSRAAQFLLSNLLIVLFLLYNPWLTPILGRLITPWMIRRISWILPSAMLVGFVAYEGVDGAPSRQSFVTRNRALGGILLILSLLPIIALAGSDTARGMQILREREKEALREDELSLLRFLGDKSQPGALVMAPQGRINLHIPAFAGGAGVLTVRRSEAAPSATEDVSRFYQKRSLDRGAIETLRRHGVRYVIMTSDHEVTSSSSPYSLVLRKIHQAGEFELFQVISEFYPSDHVALGNTWLIEGQTDKAVAEFKQALRSDSQDIMAHLGLAHAYQIEGSWVDASREYRRALEDSPSSLKGDLVQYITQLTEIDRAFVPSFFALASGPEVSQARDLGASERAYDLLGLFNRDGRLDGDSGVRESVFVIGGKPKGVVFQHPRSHVSYAGLNVPTASYLGFALALAPEAWGLGKGDGVQFDVYVDNGSEIYHPFSEYIDPKNVPGHRRWHDRDIDLSVWAGQVITLTLTTGCGPNNDCRYDWAGWGEPRIVQAVAYDFLAQLSSANSTTTDHAQIRQDTFAIDYQPRSVLFQHPSNCVVYHMDVPEGAGLRFGLGMDPSVWSPEKGNGVEYNVYVRRPDDPYVLHRVFHHYLDPKNNLDDRHWQDEVVDLSDYGGETVDILFETLPGPNGDARYDWAGWSRPVLVADDMALLNQDVQVTVSTHGDNP